MDGVERCDAAEIHQVLVAAAQPQSRLILDQPLGELHLVSGVVRFTTASLWRLELWCVCRQLVMTMQAVAPDGRRWDYGCQRKWDSTGAVIDPLELLSAEEREQLMARLEAAVSWPEPHWEEGNVLPDFERRKVAS